VGLNFSVIQKIGVWFRKWGKF